MPQSIAKSFTYVMYDMYLINFKFNYCYLCVMMN